MLPRPVFIYLSLLLFTISCTSPIENHSNDGVYVGITLSDFAWKINGKQVAVYYLGDVKHWTLEHGDGFIKLIPHGTIFKIQNDPKYGKCLVQEINILFNNKLILVSDNGNLPDLEVQNLIYKYSKH